MSGQNKIQVGIKLSRWVVDKLRAHPEKIGPHLERCVVEAEGWVPPDECMGDEAGRKPE